MNIENKKKLEKILVDVSPQVKVRRVEALPESKIGRGRVIVNGEYTVMPAVYERNEPGSFRHEIGIKVERGRETACLGLLEEPLPVGYIGIRRNNGTIEITYTLKRIENSSFKIKVPTDKIPEIIERTGEGRVIYLN